MKSNSVAQQSSKPADMNLDKTAIDSPTLIHNTEPQEGKTNGEITDGPLVALMERTGYKIVQENGQRLYGPPPDWNDQPPPRGCEVFVGKIPRDCMENELVPVFEKAGKIYEVRMMMDFNGHNRGYCFVTYTNKTDAKRAVKELNDHEIRPRRYLGFCLSVDNCRLFVGGIPRDKQGPEILEEMKKLADGVVDAIVYPSIADKTKNRGFAFVEFESHRAAAMARRKLLPGRFQLWGQQIAVDWAEPEQDVDEDIMSKVKILYVRNLMLSTSEETIHRVFTEAASSGKGIAKSSDTETQKENKNDDVIERVKKLKDYAFVHFKDRDSAARALDAMNGHVLEGSKIEVVWAKPAEKDNNNRNTAKNNQFAGYPNVAINPGALQPVGPPAGPYMPTVLYPYPTNGLQNFNTRSMPHPATRETGNMPQNFTHRGRTAAGSRSAGGTSRGFNMRKPDGNFRQPITREKLYDIQPGMELVPTNPHTLKPHRSPNQQLEELCQKNGWGMPTYHLHQAVGRDSASEMQLFVFKVYIPGLNPNPFMPNKLCRSVEEAKKIAAEHILAQLGSTHIHPVEGVYPYSASSYPTSGSMTASYTLG